VGQPAAATGGVGVQVGAFSSKEAAETGWGKLVGQAHGALSGVSHRVAAGTADNGTIYRLQAVAPDAAAAGALCGRLKSAGIACQVK
jgi:cell division protein FtsN